MSLGIAYTADESPRVGATPVFGYQLIRRLGSGGHGEVWQAEGPGGFQVALKFIRQDDGPSAGDIRALEILREIRHPNLLLTFGAWQVPGFLVLGMELADGTLWDRFCQALDQGLPGIPRTELLESLAETAKGIDYLNSPGITPSGLARPGIQHRDLKPQNILLAGGGVKVADFGLARQIDHSLASHTGNHWTFAYAAPEFFRKQTASQSDQYSLAATYCHLRGGRTPFQGPAAVIMAGHLLFPPDLLMIPAEERPVVARALSKEPKERWPNCRAFVEALRAAVPLPEIGDEDQPAPKTDLGWLAMESPTPPDEWATRTKPVSAPPTETWQGEIQAVVVATVPPQPAPAEEPPALDPVAVPVLLARPAPLPIADAHTRRARKRKGGVRKLTVAATTLAIVGFGLGTPGLLAPTISAPSGLTATIPDPPDIAPADPASAVPRLEIPEVVAADREGADLKVTPLVLNPPQAPAPAPEMAPAPEAAPEPALATAKLVGLAHPPAAKARSLALKAPGHLTIVAGKPAHLAFEVTRVGVDGPVSARIEGLPPGVTAEEMTLGRDEEVAVFRITVAADALSTEFPVRLVAVADDTRAEAPLKVAIEPSKASILLHKARGLFDGGKHAEALVALDEALALSPDDPSAFMLRGMISIKAASHERAVADKAANYERAIADFTEALKRRPRDPTAYNNRGLARRALGDYHRAIADYDEAIRLKPRDAIFHYNRGMAYHLIGDDVGAIANYTKAIDLDPAHAPSYRCRGEAFANRGEVARSRADLDVAKRLEGKTGRATPGRVHPQGEEPAATTRSRHASATTTPTPLNGYTRLG